MARHKKTKSDLPPFNIGDLANFLADKDQKIPIVTFDHFGRPMPLEKWNFQIRQDSLGNAKIYLEVTTPDIGPEPD